MLSRLRLWAVPALAAVLPILGCAGLAPQVTTTEAAVGAPDASDARNRTAALLDRVILVEGRLRVAPSSTESGAGNEPSGDVDDLLRHGARADALERLLDAAASGDGASGDGPGLSARGWMLLGHLLERASAADEGLAALEEAVRRAAADERVTYEAFVARALGRQARHAEAADRWSRIAAEASVDAALAEQARRRRIVESYFAGRADVAREHLVDLGHGPSDDLLRALVTDGAPPRAPVRTLSAAVDATRFGVGPAVRVDTGGAAEAAEPSIVALGDEVVVAWNDERDPDGTERWRLGVGVSTDGGASWTDQLLREPPVPAQDGDPMTAVDARTGSLWVGAIRFNGAGSEVFVARRPSGGSFGAPVLLNTGSGFDKCWMDAGIAPGQPASTRLYVAYSFPSALQRSSDLGATWSSPVGLDPGGLAFLPRVGPAGELTVGYFDFDDFVVGDEIRLQRSLDGGVTVGPPGVAALRMDVWGLQDGSRVPGDFRVPTIPVWSVDPTDGTLYLVYFDTTAVVDGNADLDLYITRSSDGGATWTVPRALAVDGGDQFFPWLKVDANGRLHLVFFDSRHTVQDDTAVDGRFDVYYATSFDRGDSWSELRLTETSFGTAGIEWPVFGQFLGDYLGLTLTSDTADGPVLVSYPRTGGADLDLYVQRIERVMLFADGFESGGVGAWSSSAP